MSKMLQFPQKEIKPITGPGKPGDMMGYHLNQKYMMPEELIRQVYDDGNVIGIECSLRINQYHGSPLSMLKSITARYDGLEFVNDPMTLTVCGHKYKFDEMKTMSTIFWEFGDFVQLFIPIPGGVGLGVHKLEVGITWNSGIRPGRAAWVSATINFIEN